MTFFPAGHDQGKAIENELAKAGIVLRKIIKVRLIQAFGRASVVRDAVKIAGTTDFE